MQENRWSSPKPPRILYKAPNMKHPSLHIKKSYGIALCRFNTQLNEYEILMIKKRYTYCFVEFVLGHYNKNNDARLLYLLNRMTNEEKIDILSLDFGQIWYRIWLVNPESIYTSYDKKLTHEEHMKYVNCKKHYERCFLVDKGERLISLINKTHNDETLWEIPKGRKSYPQEKEINCAIREFYEETRIDNSQYTILFDISPKKLIYTNTKARYINYFYIAVSTSPITDKDKFVVPDAVDMDSDIWRRRRHNKFRRATDKLTDLSFTNKHQVSEVISMKWISLSKLQLIDKDRSMHNMVRGLFKLLRKRKKIGALTTLGLI